MSAKPLWIRLDVSTGREPAGCCGGFEQEGVPVVKGRARRSEATFPLNGLPHLDAAVGPERHSRFVRGACPKAALRIASAEVRLRSFMTEVRTGSCGTPDRKSRTDV